MSLQDEIVNANNNSPIDLTNPLEWIIYIVIPIVLLAVYFWIRKKGKRSSSDQMENDN